MRYREADFAVQRFLKTRAHFRRVSSKPLRGHRRRFVQDLLSAQQSDLRPLPTRAVEHMTGKNDETLIALHLIHQV